MGVKVGLNLNCGSCGQEVTCQVQNNAIIESIESTGLFYCLQDRPGTFLIVCVMCGKDERFSYE